MREPFLHPFFTPCPYRQWRKETAAKTIHRCFEEPRCLHPFKFSIAEKVEICLCARWWSDFANRCFEEFLIQKNTYCKWFKIRVLQDWSVELVDLSFKSSIHHHDFSQAFPVQLKDSELGQHQGILIQGTRWWNLGGWITASSNHHTSSASP